MSYNPLLKVIDSYLLGKGVGFFFVSSSLGSSPSLQKGFKLILGAFKTLIGPSFWGTLGGLPMSKLSSDFDVKGGSPESSRDVFEGLSKLSSDLEDIWYKAESSGDGLIILKEDVDSGSSSEPNGFNSSG